MTRPDKAKQWQEDYQQIPIPPQLDQVINDALLNERKIIKMKNIQNRRKRFKQISISAAAVACLFVGSINVSPALASTLSDIPGLKGLVSVCTFRDYAFHEDTYDAKVAVPQIDGLSDDIKTQLNEKYLTEGRALYEQFQGDIADMKATDVEGHLGVDSGYEIKTNNETIFSIARYVVNTVGSSSTTLQLDTVDVKNQLIVTLPSLFKENSDYITVISDTIKEQMATQMEEDDSKFYWLNDEMAGDANFQQIKADQNFYINAEGKLVMSFDKYEVAPGYMGLVEFVIPTESINDILVPRGLIQ